MEKIPVKKYIKLGTAVRYLIDVDAGEQLGNGRVIDNIRAVTDLVQELQLTTTKESGAYQKLTKILGELNRASTEFTKINEDQAQRLEAIARKVRQSLLTEGDERLLYSLCDDEVKRAESKGWPTKINTELVLGTPWKYWSWLIGLLVASFSAGLWFGQTNIFGVIRQSLDVQSQGAPKDPVHSGMSADEGDSTIESQGEHAEEKPAPGEDHAVPNSPTGVPPH